MANTVSTRIVVNSKDAESAFKGLGATIRNNVLAGQLWADAFSGAINVVTGGLGKVVDGFKQAMDIQGANISIAGDFAKLSGVSFTESGKIIDDFTLRMSKAAASLPGVTQGYVDLGKSLTDELIPSFKRAEGDMDMKGFNEALDELSISAAIRADSAGVTIAESGRALAKLLAGNTTIAQLKRLDFFEKNKAVIATIESDLAASGQELKEMSSQEILKLARKAIGIQDEVIEASKLSVDGIIQGFASSLFDPTSGIFGVMRDTDTNLQGQQSVFKQFGRTVALVFGANGLVPAIAQVFADLGFDTDVMDSLYKGIGRFNTFLRGVIRVIDNFDVSSLSQFGSLDGIGDFGSVLRDMAFSAGQWLSDKFNGGLSAIANIDPNLVGEGLGKLIAAGLNAAIGFARGVDWGLVIRAIKNVILVPVLAVKAAVLGLDWPSLGILLFKSILIPFRLLGATIKTVVEQGAIAVMGVLRPVFEALKDAFNRVKTITEASGIVLKSAVESMLDGLIGLMNSAKDAIVGAINRLPGINIPTGGGRVKNSASGLNAGGLLAAVERESRAMPTGAQIVVANSSEAILNQRQQRQAMRGGGLSVGHITINAGTTSDPNILADQVMAALDRKWTAYSQNRMTAAF